MTEQLRDEVARAVHGNPEYWECTNPEEQEIYYQYADAAIAIVLERAFKAIPDALNDFHIEDGRVDSFDRCVERVQAAIQSLQQQN